MPHRDSQTIRTLTQGNPPLIYEVVVVLLFIVSMIGLLAIGAMR